RRIAHGDGRAVVGRRGGEPGRGRRGRGALDAAIHHPAGRRGHCEGALGGIVEGGHGDGGGRAARTGGGQLERGARGGRRHSGGGVGRAGLAAADEGSRRGDGEQQG